MKISNTQWIWKGERKRRLAAYRPCWCGCDYRDGALGVGYLSGSDRQGNGFTVWIEDEQLFARLEAALKRQRRDQGRRVI